MHQLPYLAAHQLIHQRYTDEFETAPVPSDASHFDEAIASGTPRVDVFRVAVAGLLRRAADRVAPLEVRSGV